MNIQLRKEISITTARRGSCCQKLNRNKFNYTPLETQYVDLSCEKTTKCDIGNEKTANCGTILERVSAPWVRYKLHFRTKGHNAKSKSV